MIKFRNPMSLLIVVLSLILFNNGFAQEKKFATLGFKGIHLGMTQAEVNEVVNSGKGWSFKSGPNIIGNYLNLNTDSPIGCRGQGETEECYKIKTVTLQFFEGRVIQIFLRSPQYAATDIDYYVKGWARFGLQVLKKKFGDPSTVNLSIDRFNIFSVRSSGDLEVLYYWYKKDEAILLSIGSDDFEYYAAINYVNGRAAVKINQEKQKIKSEMGSR